MRKRCGFTLIEILIALTIAGIMAAVVYPMVGEVRDLTYPTTMAATVRQVRQQVEYHTAVADVPLSMEGYPKEIDPRWFANGRLPKHAWTRSPLKIQTVNGPKNRTVPQNISYQVKKGGGAAGHTAWYNAANGSFCALVPAIGSDAQIAACFDFVNALWGDDGDGHGRG